MIPWWWPMMAEAVDAGKETLSVSAWLALIGGLAGILTTFLQRNNLRAKGKAEGRQEVMDGKVSIEGQPIGVQVVQSLATKDELSDMEDRIEDRLNKIEQEQGKQREVARDQLGKVHFRLDRVIENQATSRGELTQISQNVQLLLSRRNH